VKEGEGAMDVIIIDDEPYSRVELKHLLEEYKDIKVVGEASSAEMGIPLILKNEPQVVFLDIEMPGMNGVELAETLTKLKHKPEIVFATAYPDYAAKAFRVDAIDYLLKPYDEEQLKETIARLQKHLKPEVTIEKQSMKGKLAVQDEDKIVYLQPKEIQYIYREERDTYICTSTKKYISKSPIKELEAKLAGYNFFRVHKSYLVQLSYVNELIPWGNGVYQLKLSGVKEPIPVSRNYVKELRESVEL
jgi:two-component system, LytTR family, response regulator LytT